jgi:hypothetical protein
VAAISGVDRPGRWGVMRGGATFVLGAEGGHREAAWMCAHEAAAARPGEEDDRRGPRVGERGRGGWLGRPKAEA